MKYLLLIFLIISAVSRAEPIVLCVEKADYPPFMDLDQENGVFYQFIKIMNKQSDQQIELVSRPWKRCLREVELGIFDGAFAVIYTQKRDQMFAYPKTHDGLLDNSKALWTVNYPVFVHKDSTLQWDGRTFNQSQIQVASPLGYIVSKQLGQIRSLTALNMEAVKGLKLVARKRLNAYVIEQSIGEKMIQRHDLDSLLTTLETPFMVKDWYIILSKDFTRKSPLKAGRFWESLAQVRMEHGARLYQFYMQEASGDQSE
ncbi:hypothetical protein [Psychromonas ossibalaenae]|uniref:hypothetical protein n=1 Tax=Psychromonas ossibalaenae TaxID=444922 RepID=UPI0003742D29|nr:hypothetical protein [Psychromonas ossibalaenae]